MTSDEKINYEYTQMLDEHAIWTKSSLYTNFGIKIRAKTLMDDLNKNKRGKKLAAKIYFEGLNRFIHCGFKYEFLGFI